MKLNRMRAAGLVIRFEQECRRLYAHLREKYVFTREYIAVNNTGIFNEKIDTELLEANKEFFDGDKFNCISEFYIDDVTIHINYGGEHFGINMALSIEKEGNRHFFDFEDIFNFFTINELRKTMFLYVSDEQVIEKVMKRYDEFLFSYLPVILDLSKDEDKLNHILGFREEKYKNINLTQAWHISKGDNLFEKGDYNRAVKFYAKTLPLLSHIQKVRYERSARAISDNDERIKLSQEFELENDLYYFKKIKTRIVNDTIWMVLVFLLWPIFTGLFFLFFYGIYLFYFGKMVGNQTRIIYTLKPDIGYCSIPAIFAGIIAAFYPAYRVMKKIKNKKFQDYLSTKKSSEMRMTVFSGICIALLLGGLVLLVQFGLHWRIDFTDNALYDGTEFLSLSEKRYEYKDIEGVYYVRHDIEEPEREFEFYIIKYKDGTISNLGDFCDSNDEIRNKAMPIFKEKGVKVMDVDYFKYSNK